MNVPSITGVTILIYNLNKEDEIAIEPDGYLGTVNSMELVDLKSTPQRWQSLLIELVIEPGVNVWAFHVTENADVVPARDWRAKPADKDDPAHQAPEGARIYRRLTPVTESEHMNVATTKYPNNNLRLLESVGDGYFQLWSIGIASQAGEFFLVVEKMYQPFRCYRSGETVVCPSYMGNEKNPDGWIPFITLLNRVLNGKDFDALPPIKEVHNEKPNTEPKMNGISEGEGRVVWFSQSRQYGMLMTKQGPARVHWQEIDRPGARRRHLKDGEKVTFEALNKPHLTDSRKTGFKFEAVGVTLKNEKAE